MGFRRLLAKGLRALLQPPAITNSTIHSTSKVCSGTQVNDTLIDRYTYLGHNCFTLCAEIGPFCSIADNCRIGGATHDMTRVSTSPVFSAGTNVMRKNFSEFEDPKVKRTIIEADVWLGSGVTVLSGVTIGVGAVVGAGSVVTKSVEPYSIVAGNPARLIRSRFDQSEIGDLLNLRWWEWDEDIIKRYAPSFFAPKQLMREIDKSNENSSSVFG